MKNEPGVRPAAGPLAAPATPRAGQGRSDPPRRLHRRERRILFLEANLDGTVGGSHQCLYDIVRGLDRSRFTPLVVFYQDNAFTQPIRDEGAEVHVWREEGWLGEPLRFRPSSLLKWKAAVLRRARFLRGERIDLVHINNTPGVGAWDWLPAAHLLKRPCVSHVRGLIDRPPRSRTRFVQQRFDRVIAISKHIAARAEAAGIPRERITLVYDGIDGDAFRSRVTREPAAVRASLGVPDDVLLAGMIGHLRRWKAQDVVLRALARLGEAHRRRLHVVFAGDSPRDEREYQDELRRLVQAAGLRSTVSFLGPRADVPDLMNACDTVLHASRAPEPFGLVVLEAMVLGKAVVASALGGPGEIITPGSGLTFQPDDVDELARILAALIEDPVLRMRLGNAAPQRARAFTTARMIDEIQNIYDELLGGKGTSCE